MSNWIDTTRPVLKAEFGANPWVCIMATVNEHSQPTARCMVLREIDRDGQLWFVSDRRTRKDDHLRANPETEICFWLPKQRVQLRIRGRATVMDAQTDQYFRQVWWDKIAPENREIFGAAPGDQDPPMPVTFELISVTPGEIELQDLKLDAHQKKIWRNTGEGKLALIM